MFRKLQKNKRGSVNLILTSVIGLVVAFVVLFIGLLLNGTLQNTADAMDLGVTGNATRSALETNVNMGFSLFSIAPIIIAAGGIIALIVGAFYLFSRGR